MGFYKILKYALTGVFCLTVLIGFIIAVNETQISNQSQPQAKFNF